MIRISRTQSTKIIHTLESHDLHCKMPSVRGGIMFPICEIRANTPFRRGIDQVVIRIVFERINIFAI